MEAPILWPLLVYAVLVLIVAAGMLVLSYLLGERRDRGGKGVPYESGIVPTTSARLRFGIKFYQVALFFVIFDLEAAFLLTWAIAFRDLGWAGYIEAVIFMTVLFLALVYLWRVGALDWGSRALRHEDGRRKGAVER